MPPRLSLETPGGASDGWDMPRCVFLWERRAYAAQRLAAARSGWVCGAGGLLAWSAPAKGDAPEPARRGIPMRGPPRGAGCCARGVCGECGISVSHAVKGGYAGRGAARTHSCIGVLRGRSGWGRWWGRARFCFVLGARIWLICALGFLASRLFTGGRG